MQDQQLYQSPAIGRVGGVIVVLRTFPELVGRSLQNLVEIGLAVRLWNKSISFLTIYPNCIYQWWVRIKIFWPSLGQFLLLVLGRVNHLWFGFGFGKFPLKYQILIFSLRVTWLKGRSFSYLLQSKVCFCRVRAHKEPH